FRAALGRDLWNQGIVPLQKPARPSPIRISAATNEPGLTGGACGHRRGFGIYQLVMKSRKASQPRAYVRIKPIPSTTTLTASTSAPAYNDQIHLFGRSGVNDTERKNPSGIRMAASG